MVEFKGKEVEGGNGIDRWMLSSSVRDMNLVKAIRTILDQRSMASLLK